MEKASTPRMGGSPADSQKAPRLLAPFTNTRPTAGMEAGELQRRPPMKSYFLLIIFLFLNTFDFSNLVNSFNLINATTKI